MIPICEVIIREKIGWDAFDVWFISYRHDRTMTVYYPSGGSCTIKEGDLMPAPSLEIAGKTLIEFVSSAKGSYPASEQMHNHLKDCIAVRDRLLTLVEKVTK